jgi:hypothetical protein
MDGRAASRAIRFGVGGLLLWVGVGRVLYPAPFVDLLRSLWAPLNAPGPAYVLGSTEAILGALILSNLATRHILRLCRGLAFASVFIVVMVPSRAFVGGPLPVLSACGQGLMAYAVVLYIASIVATPRAAIIVRRELARGERDCEPLFSPTRQSA